MKKLKVCMLLLIVIFNLMFVSSCWIEGYLPYQPSKAFETGCGRFNPDFATIYDFLIRSDKNIFSIDDVSLEISLGLGYYIEEGDKYLYMASLGDEYVDLHIYYNKEDPIPYSINCVFFEYVNNREGLKNPVFTGEVPPFIEKLDVFHEVVLKNINIDDVFNDKYGYTIDENSNDYIYNNSEIITIPKECFDKESGEFCIGIKLDYFYTIVFYFRYYKLEENTIQIEFEYENFRYNRDIEVEEKFSWEIKALKKYYLDKHNEELEK